MGAVDRVAMDRLCDGQKVIVLFYDLAGKFYKLVAHDFSSCSRGTRWITFPLIVFIPVFRSQYEIMYVESCTYTCSSHIDCESLSRLKSSS